MDYSKYLDDILQVLIQMREELSFASYNMVALLSAIGSLGAAVAGLWAANAASRAAINAEKMARRGLLRTVRQVLYDVVSEVEQARSLLEGIKRHLQDIALLRGGQFMGATDIHTRTTLKAVREADARYEPLVSRREQAQKLIDQPPLLEASTDEELAQQLSGFDHDLTQARLVKTLFEQQLKSHVDELESLQK